MTDGFERKDIPVIPVIRAPSGDGRNSEFKIFIGKPELAATTPLNKPVNAAELGLGSQWR
jgi:hypothetical protein